MNCIFFGTPPFAAEILQYLIDSGISIVGVVTQPDKPQGRNLQLAPSAVKRLACQRLPQIPILQPEKCSQLPFLERLAELKADLYVVVAFGQILPKKLLDMPPMGCINLHASLLPKYRGAAPMQRCLMNGDEQTGVCVQKMVYKLDAGDVIDEARIPVPLEMTLGELQEKLAEISKPLLVSVIRRYRQGIPPAVPQDEDLVTFAAKIQPEETELHWSLPAEKLHNLVRSLSPRPGAWTWLMAGAEKKRLKILKTAVSSKTGVAGEILSFHGDCVVACGSGSLQLLLVQSEGKKAMAASEWMRGFRDKPRFVV